MRSSLKNETQKTEKYLFDKILEYFRGITSYRLPFLTDDKNMYKWDEYKNNEKLLKSNSWKIFGKHWTSDEDDLKGDLNKIWKTWKDKSKDDKGKKFKDVDSKKYFIIEKMWDKIYQYTKKYPNSTFVDKAEQKK